MPRSPDGAPSGNTGQVTDEHRTLRLALAQVNTTVGDIQGNTRLVSSAIGRAREAGAQLVVFPEQTLTGYPAEDLWLKPHFLEAAASSLRGARGRGRGDRRPGRVPRARGRRPTTRSPCSRTARPGRLPQGPASQLQRLRRAPLLRARDTPALIEVDGRPVGLTICEDIWYPGPPARGGARGRQPDRQPVGLPVPPRQGRRREGMVRSAPARPARVRPLQPGRRPGRAGLRRPQRRRLRTGETLARASPVRGGTPGLRRPAAAQRAAPPPESRRCSRRASGRWPIRGPAHRAGGGRARGSPSRWSPTPRSMRR